MIITVLTGCSVFRDAGTELGKDFVGMQAEFARLYFKENSQ
jgi:hypothetical protein